MIVTRLFGQGMFRHSHRPKKVKAAGSSKTSVSVYSNTQCHIPKDQNLNIHNCDNLKPYIVAYNCYAVCKEEIYLKSAGFWDVTLFHLLEI
jgi:hypothetical protein